MGNILLALDTANTDMPALDFACYMAKLTRWKLKVVAIKSTQTSTVPVITLWPTAKATNHCFSANGAAEVETISANDELHPYYEACQNRGVEAVIDGAEEMGFYDIIALTRFSDLLIVGAGTTPGKEVPDCLSGYVKSLLRQAECPVMLSPSRFESIDRIVFAYNGSKSSVFAIKQFAYLFPQFAHKAVTVLEINKHYDLKKDERKYMHHWLQTHYQQVDFECWEGSTPFTLFRYFLEKENTLLVIGSFGRSVLSEAFRPGASTKVLKYIDLPVFITHH